MRKKRPQYPKDDGPLTDAQLEQIEATVRRTHGRVMQVDPVAGSELFNQLSHHEAALNMLAMATDRLAAAGTIEEPRFSLVVPSMICDSAVSFACALLRVRGVAIKSDTDPHIELCDRLAEQVDLEHLDAERLMRDIGDWGEWLGDRKKAWNLAARSLNFMLSAAVILQSELPEAAWDAFDEQFRALATRPARASREPKARRTEARKADYLVLTASEVRRHLNFVLDIIEIEEVILVTYRNVVKVVLFAPWLFRALHDQRRRRRR